MFFSIFDKTPFQKWMSLHGSVSFPLLSLSVRLYTWLPFSFYYFCYHYCQHAYYAFRISWLTFLWPRNYTDIYSFYISLCFFVFFFYKQKWLVWIRKTEADPRSCVPFWRILWLMGNTGPAVPPSSALALPSPITLFGLFIPTRLHNIMAAINTVAIILTLILMSSVNLEFGEKRWVQW